MPNVLDQLRSAISKHPESRRRISLQTGIAESVLCRFLHGETGLTFQTAERLAKFFDMEILLRSTKKKGC